MAFQAERAEIPGFPTLEALRGTEPFLEMPPG